MSSWGGAYPRIARWLGVGFEAKAIAYDSVLIDGPPNVETTGFVSKVGLGCGRARWALPALARYLRESQPSVTLIQPAAIAILGIVAGKLANTPVIPWESTVASLDVAEVPLHIRPYRVLERVAYRGVPAVAAVSADVMTDLRANLGDRFHKPLDVIANPIDGDEVRRLATPAARKTGRFRIVAVGRLNGQKGFDVLVRAMALATSRLKSDWEVLIVGDGPDRESLEELVQQERLEERIQLLGWMDNPYNLMASADLFVHPARWEGFSITVGEALALGLPVIGTNSPGATRSMLDGVGTVVEAGDPHDLCDAIVALESSPAERERLGSAAMRRSDDFAPHHVASLLTKWLSGLGLLDRRP